MGSRAAYADRGKPLRIIGQRIGTSLYALLRAEAALCDNDLITAHASLRAGLAHATKTSEHRVDAELHRLHAECLRRSGKTDRAAAIDNVEFHRSSNGYKAAASRLAAVVASFDADEALPELATASNLLRGDFSAA